MLSEHNMFDAADAEQAPEEGSQTQRSPLGHVSANEHATKHLQSDAHVAQVNPLLAAVKLRSVPKEDLKHREGVDVFQCSSDWKDRECNSRPLEFHFFMPREAKDLSTQADRYPLIIYLHGSGLRGKPLSSIIGEAARGGIPRWISNTMAGDDDVWDGPCRYCIDSSILPCAVFAPLVCPRTQGGFRSQFKAIWDKVDELACTYPIDLQRVYVSGKSMGGASTWEMGWTYPDRIAALAPVCGGGQRDGPAHAARLAELGMPVWIFHGDSDALVHCSEAEVMYNAMLQAGASHGTQLKFSRIPGADHYQIVPIAYDGSELYKWLAAHSLQTRVTPCTVPGPPLFSFGSASAQPIS